MLISTALKSIFEVLTAVLLKIQDLECCVESRGVGEAPADPVPLRGHPSVQNTKICCGFFRTKFRSSEGSTLRILRDQGVTCLIILGWGGDYRGYIYLGSTLILYSHLSLGHLVPFYVSLF